MTTTITRRAFGQLGTGEHVERFTLVDGDGFEVSIITYGAAVQTVLAPDRDGAGANVALGFATLDGYASHAGHYFGATIGRYANRIAGGRLVVDGVAYTLSQNEGRNCLHGGARGFDTKIWQVLEASGDVLALACASPDGDMGFPGDLETRVEFRVKSGELRIDYHATASAPTVLNLTNHTCWNLAGEGSASVGDHVLELNASSYTPVGPELIPTGEIALVDGTPLDFRRPAALGARRVGYDQNFVLDRDEESLVRAARVVHPTSGRVLEVLTTEPGIQLYTGTSLDGTLIGTGGRPYLRGSCIALETQHFPDAPNHPAFPPTTLNPGEVFESTTVYRFGAYSSRGERGFSPFPSASPSSGE